MVRMTLVGSKKNGGNLSSQTDSIHGSITSDFLLHPDQFAKVWEPLSQNSQAKHPS